MGSAKSNLYIYTDWRRFDVQLVTGLAEAADYVVYLENPKEKSKPKADIQWIPFNKTMKNEGLTFTVQRLGRAKKDLLFVEFSIRDSVKKKIDPGWIWLTQDGNVKSIHNLFLSGLEIRASEPLKGTVLILTKDISPESPLRIELRRKKSSHLTLPKVSSWK